MITLWVCALVLIVAIIAYGVIGISRGKLVVRGNPETMSDVVRTYVESFVLLMQRIAQLLRPLLAGVLVSGSRVLYQGSMQLYGNVSAKIFGKHAVPRGNRTSFFIKHIREFKEELVRDARLMDD